MRRVWLAVWVVLGFSWSWAAEIAVVGIGTVFAEPDAATLDIGVVGIESDVGAAVARVNATIHRVRAALEGLGVAALDMRTSGFGVWQEERWEEPDGPPRTVGYRVYHTLSVRLVDLSNIAAVIDAAVAAGANQLGGVSFQFADTRLLEREARARAFADARERAMQLAELMASPLGPVVEIREGGSVDGIDPYVALRSDGMGGGPSGGLQAVRVTLWVRFGSTR